RPAMVRRLSRFHSRAPAGKKKRADRARFHASGMEGQARRNHRRSSGPFYEVPKMRNPMTWVMVGAFMLYGIAALAAAQTINPGEVWPDERGQHIQAHGG